MFFVWSYLVNIQVIHLRCHKKKQKCCRKESTLLPVNGMYTCRRVPQHTTLNMTATADTAQFISHRQVTPPDTQHFRSDLCKGHGDLLLEVSFFLWSLYTNDLTYPYMKSLETSSPGNSRAIGWTLHGCTSDCCMCHLKTPAPRDCNVVECRHVGRWWCPVPHLASVAGVETPGACLGSW
jgi:hypothetical protein